MHLVRDLLDQALVDRNGRNMGRVDRVVMDIGEHAPPPVVAIEVGAAALGARLSASVGRWIAGFLHGWNVDHGQPLRIDVHQILDATDHVKVELAFGETPAANVERRLRRFISAIPGANR